MRKRLLAPPRTAAGAAGYGRRSVPGNSNCNSNGDRNCILTGWTGW
ncbi:MAG TPA: hypothetical protein VKA84_26895 [Gemmatimonadaceae bacterium]|nr:hypothetical protein [Gemmatimonadaceae bacterium]